VGGGAIVAGIGLLLLGVVVYGYRSRWSKLVKSIKASPPLALKSRLIVVEIQEKEEKVG
jgi:hypothetical protein